MTREQKLEAALRATFLRAEQIAVASFSETGKGGWTFNDQKWRAEDRDGFVIAKRARDLLGLPPYEYRGKEYPPGRA